MKKLLLLRHAKTCRDRVGLDDFDRTLTDRGRADAIRMGHFLRGTGLVPGEVLCSPAARTRQTLEFVLPALPESLTVHYERELYLAKTSKIVELLRHGRVAETLLVIGHNPGLEYCARTLARLPHGHKARALYDSMTEKFPTAALAVLAFDIAEWNGIEPGVGTLERFVRPRDLGGEDD